MHCHPNPIASAAILIAVPLLSGPLGVRTAQKSVDAAASITLSAGFPRYDRSLLLETTSETSANISFGDLDKDGHLDIVLAKGRHWPLVDRVLLGDGRGGVRSAYDLGPASDRSYSARLADLDADGSLDVVISNDSPDPKRVYLNDGHGRFTAASTFGNPEWATRNAAVADMNGDGLPDIIVANRAEATQAPGNYVCLNRGGGRFDADCLVFARYPATTIAPADVNRDGRMDVVVPHRDGGQSYVYMGGASPILAESRRTLFGPADAHIRMAEAADVNGDGLTDIVAIDERGGVAAYFGQRSGAFSTATRIAGPTPVPYALALSDLNGDGTIDVIVGHVEAAPAIYVNGGSGRDMTQVRFGDAKGTVYGFAVADFDGDKVLDIGVARSDAPNVLYFGTRPPRAK
jgi:hypothetical protein